MKLEGANPSPAIDGMDKLPGIVNYFIGNDPAKWRTKIPTYAKVQYKDAYPGIDLAYYGNQGKLEYDFIVSPGADPNQIKLAFEGASDIQVADSGDLLLTTALGEVRMQKPIVYQLEADGHKTLVAGNYVLQPTLSISSPSQGEDTGEGTLHEVGIQLASYDRTKPVVIDPVLVYSTYLGGSGDDYGKEIAVDAVGQAYVIGLTTSIDFPTASPVQAAHAGGTYDAFVAKFNAAGSALLYGTYLGGNSFDGGEGIAVDGTGQAYVTGYTASTDYPTVSPFQGAPAGGAYDAFVLKLVESNPPVCNLAQPSVPSLWAPNHDMVPVSINGITDPNSLAVSITYPQVTQDEPLSGLFEGDVGPDAAVSGQQMLLRAERGPQGDGRVYEVHFTATNSQGGSCSGTVQVRVPHSRRDTAVDSGQAFNSLLP